MQKVEDFFTDDFKQYLNSVNDYLSDISSPSLVVAGITVHNRSNLADERMADNIDVQFFFVCQPLTMYLADLGASTILSFTYILLKIKSLTISERDLAIKETCLMR